jgi:ribosomal protein L7/L12
VIRHKPLPYKDLRRIRPAGLDATPYAPTTYDKKDFSGFFLLTLTITEGRILEKEKMMIKIDLSVREALNLVTNNHCGHDMFEKVVTALEVALGVNQRCTVTITNMSLDNRISCIKAIRNYTGWALKEAKVWTDQIVGYYKEGRWYGPVATRISVKLQTMDAAENLLRDLVGCGCEGYLS